MAAPDDQGLAGDPRPERPATELSELRATCERQSRVIDGLGEAVAKLRCGVTALKEENAELRIESDGMRREATRRLDGHVRPDREAWPEVSFGLDAHAPAQARRHVAQVLRDDVAAPVLDTAQLIVSELVTNSLRHGGAAAARAPVTVRIELAMSVIWLEVEDAGTGGAIARVAPDLDGGGGFGLQLVQAVSRRWGVEHTADGATRVWVQLSRAV